MGSSTSRIDDNNISILRQNYAKIQSIHRTLKKSKKRVSKNMIGQPSNFQHTHHIGSGDYQTNNIGVQEQIAEITVIFNTTNKSTGITRKPVSQKPVDLNYITKSTLSTPSAVTRRNLIRQEPFTANMTHGPKTNSNYLSKSTNAAIRSRDCFQFEDSRCASLEFQRMSSYLYSEQQKQLEMLKVDLVKLSGSEHNLRKYAACNHMLQLAPSRESFAY
ncbi:hypothetical protein BGW37DRAFT_79076 [Umbelopsis sp. PMI_123]|nr:hypothetical protein BGW37DRAFT_79076 [Umbelopsis sp. PMI_123]